MRWYGKTASVCTARWPAPSQAPQHQVTCLRDADNSEIYFGRYSQISHGDIHGFVVMQGTPIDSIWFLEAYFLARGSPNYFEI